MKDWALKILHRFVLSNADSSQRRQFRRDVMDSMCSDIFCLEDPCRWCPNREDHVKLCQRYGREPKEEFSWYRGEVDTDLLQSIKQMKAEGKL